MRSESEQEEDINNSKQRHLPLANVASPGKVEGGRTLRDTERLLGFSANGRHMSARALRHFELSEDASSVPEGRRSMMTFSLDGEVNLVKRLWRLLCDE